MGNSNIKLSEESLRQFITNTLNVVKDKSFLSIAKLPIKQIPLEVITSFIKEDIALNYTEEFSGTIHYTIEDEWDLEVSKIGKDKVIVNIKESTVVKHYVSTAYGMLVIDKSIDSNYYEAFVCMDLLLTKEEMEREELSEVRTILSTFNQKYIYFKKR